MNVICSMFLQASGYGMFAVFAVTQLIGIAGSLVFGRGHGVLVAAFFPAIACGVGWSWAVGSLLALIVPRSQRRSAGMFRFGLIHCLLYALLLVFAEQCASQYLLRKLVAGLMVPWLLVSTFSVVYCINWIAESLSAALNDGPAKASTTRVVLMGLVLLPVGILWIQPYISELHERHAGCWDRLGVDEQSMNDSKLDAIELDTSIIADFLSGLLWGGSLHYIVFAGMSGHLFGMGEYVSLIVHVGVTLCIATTLCVLRRWSIAAGYVVACTGVPILVIATLGFMFAPVGTP